MRWMFATDDGWPGLILRLTAAIVILPHGAQKLLGWFGGGGFSGTIGFFTTQLSVPAFIAFLVIVAEFFGGLALIAGLLTRFSAVSLAVIMLGAVALVHWPNGFFMNWFGAQAGEGFEYHILYIGLLAALTLTGGGRWSVDGWIARTRYPQAAEGTGRGRKSRAAAA